MQVTQRRVKVNDNGVVENASLDVEEVVDESAHMIEKAGTAISVLLYLSKL